MNGFAGLRRPRNLRRGVTGLKELARNLWRGCAGLVAGLVAFIEKDMEIKRKPKSDEIILSPHYKTLKNIFFLDGEWERGL